MPAILTHLYSMTVPHNVAVLTTFKCHCLTMSWHYNTFQIPLQQKQNNIYYYPFNTIFFVLTTQPFHIIHNDGKACFCTILVLCCSDHHQTPWEQCELSLPHHTNIISLTGAVNQLTAPEHKHIFHTSFFITTA